MLTLAHPLVFALLPLPWLVRALLPPRSRTMTALRVPFGDRIRAAAGMTSSRRLAAGWRATALRGLLWLLLLVALARPQWLERPIEKIQPTRDLLLLVDLSGSMKAEDFVDAEGAVVDRLSAVKEVLGDFLVRREGDRIGLVVFGDAPFLQAPFSTDLGLVRKLLDETAIGMAGPRTALGDAIGLGVSLFAASDAPAKTIIALTDGNDTKSQVPPIEAARVAGERDIRIHTVAIGDPTTVGEEKLDEDALEAVARESEGSYFFAADRSRLDAIYDELDRIETKEIKVTSFRPRLDLYHLPLLVALALSLGHAALELLRRERARPSLPTPGLVRVHPLTGKLEVEP